MSTRDLDWRFLLPNLPGDRIDRLIVLGGSPAIEQTIRNLGVARHVTTTIEPGARADALVGLGGDTSLEDAASALHEDGVLYWEVDRRQPAALGLTPARLNRQLKSLGLTASVSYLVSPSLSQRTMYLPLGCDAAIQWYLQSLFRARTWFRRAARAGLATAVDLFGLSAIAPCFAVVATRGAARPPAILSTAVAEGISMHPDAAAVFLTHGSTEWNRVVALVFEPGSRSPVAAIKLSRTATFSPEIEWEHNVLHTLRSELPADIADSLPRSRVFRWNGLSVSTETCVPGASLSSRAQRASQRSLDDLDAVVHWLSAFHQHTTVARVPARQWARKQLDRAYRRYSATFGITAEEQQLFAAVARAIEGLGTETLPIVWQHGDFGPPNVYVQNRKVSVIDWETARRGPALQDLLYLMIDWTSAITGRTDDAEAVTNFSELYGRNTEQHPLFNFVHMQIARYMRDLGVAQSLFQPLLVLTLVEKALERVSRTRTLAHEATGTREKNRFVSFLGILATQVHRRRPIDDEDVTVAVATMNRPEALARCIDAILAAPRWPGELVIVDQSDDAATMHVIAQARWQDLLPVKYVKQPRRGLAASRNAAVIHASRAIIAFTDDDCVPDSQWLTAIVAAFNAPERPDVVTGRVLPLGPERPDRYAVSTRASNVTAIHRGRTLPWSVGSGGNAAARCEWLERIRSFDERLGAGSPGRSAEDMDLFYRLLREGATVRYDPKAVVYHERKDAQGRLATRPAYGFGMGTFCALALRRLDPFAAWILTRWCYDRMRALAGACLKRQWRRAHEECLMLRGVVAGVGHGMGEIGTFDQQNAVTCGEQGR